MERWKKYHEQRSKKPPSPLMLEGLNYVANKGEALDLGAGALVDSKFLAEHFSNVTSVDLNPMVPDDLPENIAVITSSFEDVDLTPETYDYISAQYSLPFIDRDAFFDIWTKITDSLKDGGVVAGQFFGDKDEWNKEGSKQTFHTREEVDSLLSSFELLKLEEIEADKPSGTNEQIKHWHLFEFIARK